MKKDIYKIIEEDGKFIPYKKRKFFGWKRLSVSGFNEMQIAIKYLAKNYGTPIMNETGLISNK